ncbi:putative mitochondrial 54S ribosomal protein YmL16 [Polychaeton citri CBS 116435]|uniref:Mitochondrial 54S ribosomal protein YmL16 n=1 Tax=Polychaeton citri CBS 116435 TaxID=1314669 RepID=A0A9P4ULN3_9PEZI|nr:putative mitochondrial 54S ribosomal protein YmL16 [Polychaeton citri CBS 116435]
MAVQRHCAQSTRSILQPLLRPKTKDSSVPIFLVPAFASPQSQVHQCQTSSFSTSPQCRSKIGRAPLSLPPGVKFNIIEAPPLQQPGNVSRMSQSSTIEIEGPLGKMSMTIPAYINIDIDNVSNTRSLRILDQQDKKQRQMWGTTRAYLQNHILGVSEGHTAILRLVGVGYRATVESSATTVTPEYPRQKFVSLKVGYSHPIELGIPKGVTASTPQPTRILLEGVEKEVVMQFAAEIREWRVPEPYKGKGIFVNNETIKLKAKKIK